MTHKFFRFIKSLVSESMKFQQGIVCIVSKCIVRHANLYNGGAIYKYKFHFSNSCS